MPHTIVDTQIWGWVTGFFLGVGGYVANGTEATTVTVPPATEIAMWLGVAIGVVTLFRGIIKLIADFKQHILGGRK